LPCNETETLDLLINFNAFFAHWHSRRYAAASLPPFT
jgi:hypothetical protein